MSDTAVPAPPQAPKPSGAKPFGAFERMVALRYLGATKKGQGVSFISIVSFLGIALSVATLIVVMSVMQGFRTTLLDQLLGVNGHVFVETDEDSFPDAGDLAAQLVSVQGVTRATQILRVPAGGVSGDKLVPIELIGIEPDALRAIPEIAGEDRRYAGSFDTFGEGRKGGREIALAAGVARQLRVTAGDPVTLIVAGGRPTAMGPKPFTEKTYTVGAVFSIGNSQYDAIRAYMPLEQADLLTRGQGEKQVELRIEDAQNPQPVRDAVQPLIRDGLYLLDWRDYNRSFFDALQVERFMVRLILSLLVLVAALLIVSNLVTRVKDKTGDIAVLRTMGATRAGVSRIFFLSGMMIGVAGTAIGVTLGVLFVQNITAIERFLSGVAGIVLFNPNIYFLEEIPAELDWWEVRYVVIFTLILTALASIYPAMKAAKLDPVEALRYE